MTLSNDLRINEQQLAGAPGGPTFHPEKHPKPPGGPTLNSEQSASIGVIAQRSIPQTPQAPSAPPRQGPQGPSASLYKTPQAPSAPPRQEPQGPSASLYKTPQAPSAPPQQKPPVPPYQEPKGLSALPHQEPPESQAERAERIKSIDTMLARVNFYPPLYERTLVDDKLEGVSSIVLSGILSKILDHRGARRAEERHALLSQFVQTNAFKRMELDDINRVVQSRDQSEWKFWFNRPKEMSLLMNNHPQGKKISFIDINCISYADR